MSFEDVPRGAGSEAIAASPAKGLLWRAAAMIFVFGALFGVFYLIHTNLLWVKPEGEELRIAEHLVRGEGFLSPFDVSASAPPTSWSPPVYPMVMAGVFRIAGVESEASSAILTTLNAISFGATGAALFILGAVLFHRRIGLLAAALFFSHPMFLRWMGNIWDYYLALAMFAWLVAAAAWMRKFGPTPLKLIAYGCLLGLLAMTDTAYILTLPALIWIAAGNGTLRTRLRRLGIGMAAFLITLVPWTTRNALAFHKIFFVRGGASFELYFGNRPEMTGWVRRDIFDVHPWNNPTERALILRGESAYFTICRERFVEEVRHDPGAFVERCIHRTAYLFLSDPTEAEFYPFTPNWKWHGYVLVRVLFNSLLATLGLAGFWTAYRLMYRGIWLGPLLALAGAPFVAAHVWDRYTFPVRVLLLMGVAFLVAAVWHRLSEGEWPSPRTRADDARIFKPRAARA